MSEKPDAKDSWDIVITPRGKTIALDLVNLWRYRDLILMFFKRDFIAFYKQTILGPLWYLIQPLMTATTYFVVFGKIANISTNGLPPFLFYMSGIVIWNYFSVCLTNNSEIFSKNAALFGKVYFPRLVVPISVSMSGLVALAIQLSLLTAITIGFMLFTDEARFHALIFLALPFILAHVAALGMGVGLIVSALTVRFRDLAFAAGFATQLWMYATPVVYPFSQIPDKYHWFYYLNPMTAPVETMRAAMFGTPAIPLELWISNVVIAIMLLLVGLIVFTRAESVAMDTV
jgi:lipopolysaccharide transport system permease protein